MFLVQFDSDARAENADWPTGVKVETSYASYCWFLGLKSFEVFITVLETIELSMLKAFPLTGNNLARRQREVDNLY